MKTWIVITPGDYHPLLMRVADSYDAWQADEEQLWVWRLGGFRPSVVRARTREDALNWATGFRPIEHVTYPIQIA